MSKHKFDPQHSKRLDNPLRREILPPDNILTEFGLGNDQVWVDIGCGNGYFTIPMAGIVEKIYALDISTKMLSELEDRIKEADINNVEPTPTGEVFLPLNDEVADGVLLSLVAHELQEPVKSMREIQRILKPEGRFLVIEWIKAPMEMGPPEDHRLTVPEITEWASECGFRSGRTWIWANVFMGLEFVKTEGTPINPE